MTLMAKTKNVSLTCSVVSFISAVPGHSSPISIDDSESSKFTLQEIILIYIYLIGYIYILSSSYFKIGFISLDLPVFTIAIITTERLTLIQ